MSNSERPRDTSSTDHEAPDCRGCGRRMRVEAQSVANMGGNPPEVREYVSLAECECCPIRWGEHFGWQYIARDDECKHVDFECKHDEDCPECGAPQVWEFAQLRSCPACGWEEPMDDEETEDI